MDEIRFKVKGFAEQIKQGKILTGPDGIFTDLIKKITEAALGAELDLHLDNTMFAAL